MTSLLDTVLCQIDVCMKTLLPPKERNSKRPYPAKDWIEPVLTTEQKRHVAGLMRVNHAGEVCAQALYQGQALTAKLPGVRQKMEQAAEEERDHLAWCEQRLQSLNAAPSLLNPFWYAGALVMGALAGLAGDNISLGFVAETEKQVQLHLQKHLDKLPTTDEETRAVLSQMQIDEKHHAEEAIAAGADVLPLPIQWLMSTVSKVMTFSSYYI